MRRRKLSNDLDDFEKKKKKRENNSLLDKYKTAVKILHYSLFYYFLLSLIKKKWINAKNYLYRTLLRDE
jgi:hypothetical protein